MKVNKVEIKVKEIMGNTNFFPTMIKNTRGIIMYKFSSENDTNKNNKFIEMIEENFTVKTITYSRAYKGEKNVRIIIEPLKK
jgi:hypothetical protein